MTGSSRSQLSPMLWVQHLLRFAAYAVSHLSYRFKVAGIENIPRQGAAVLVCNHVSFVDAVLLVAASPRPIRFIMAKSIFSIPVLGWMFKLARAIPIASVKEDPAMYEEAFVQARAVLDAGELLCIFPEGMLTRDGTLQPFKGGIMKVLEGREGIPIVPLALHNLWGSFFSRIEQGRAMVRPLRRGIFNRVSLIAGAPVLSEVVTPDLLRERVADLLNQPAGHRA